MAELTPVVPLPSSTQMPTLEGMRDTMFGQVAPAPYIDRFQRTLGSNLTPQSVSAILDLANLGQLYLLIDLLDEVRELDAHLASVVSKREQQVAGADWDVVPEDPKDDDHKRIASWAKRELRSLRNLQGVISHLAGGVYYSHAVCENIWVQVQGKPRIVDSVPLHPRRFAYAAHTDWRLHLWDQNGNERQPRAGMFPGVPLDAFPYGKFVSHTPRVRGGYPQREGLGRTLVWYAMMKRWAFRDWMALGEWAGRGLRIGKFATGLADDGKNKRSTPEHKKILEDALNAFSSSTPAVIADTTDINVLSLAHETRLHEVLIAVLDAQMSKASLGGTLTTDAGTHGARSLGDTQRDDQLMLAVADEKQLSASIRYGLVAPMVRYWFGPSAPVPIFKLAVQREESVLERAQLIKTLVEAGMEIPQGYAYETFGIRAPNAGERVMLPKRVTVRDQDESDDTTAQPTDGAAPATTSQAA